MKSAGLGPNRPCRCCSSGGFPSPSLPTSVSRALFLVSKGRPHRQGWYRLWGSLWAAASCVLGGAVPFSGALRCPRTGPDLLPVETKMPEAWPMSKAPPASPWGKRALLEKWRLWFSVPCGRVSAGTRGRGTRAGASSGPFGSSQLKHFVIWRRAVVRTCWQAPRSWFRSPERDSGFARAAATDCLAAYGTFWTLPETTVRYGNYGTAPDTKLRGRGPVLAPPPARTPSHTSGWRGGRGHSPDRVRTYYACPLGTRRVAAEAEAGGGTGSDAVSWLEAMEQSKMASPKSAPKDAQVAGCPGASRAGGVGSSRGHGVILGLSPPARHWRRVRWVPRMRTVAVRLVPNRWWLRSWRTWASRSTSRASSTRCWSSPTVSAGLGGDMWCMPWI